MNRLNNSLNRQLADLIPHMKDDTLRWDWDNSLAAMNTLCDHGHFLAVASLLNLVLPRINDPSHHKPLPTDFLVEISDLVDRIRPRLHREKIELISDLPGESFLLDRPIDSAASKTSHHGVEYLIEEVTVKNYKYKVIGLPGTPGLAVVPESLDRWLSKQALTL